MIKDEEETKQEFPIFLIIIYFILLLFVTIPQIMTASFFWLFNDKSWLETYFEEIEDY